MSNTYTQTGFILEIPQSLEPSLVREKGLSIMQFNRDDRILGKIASFRRRVVFVCLHLKFLAILESGNIFMYKGAR